MDVVFDEVKGNVVGPAPGPAGDDGVATTPKPADADRKIHEELRRVAARRARLAAD